MHFHKYKATFKQKFYPLKCDAYDLSEWKGDADLAKHAIGVNKRGGEDGE